jgi:hypothetical protein
LLTYLEWRKITLLAHRKKRRNLRDAIEERLETLLTAERSLLGGLRRLAACYLSVRRRPGSEIPSLVFPPSSGPPPPGVEEPLSREECLQRAAPCGAVRGTSRIATSCIAENGGHQRRAVPLWPGTSASSPAACLGPRSPFCLRSPPWKSGAFLRGVRDLFGVYYLRLGRLHLRPEAVDSSRAISVK